jgi:TonB family protein
MAFTGQTALESRVRAILDSGIDRRSVTRRLLAISVGAAIALSIPLIAQQPKVYSVKEDGVMPPRVISKVEPRYTKEARDAKISGTVILKIEIDEGGNARNVKIEKGLDAGLDENAIRAVEAWVFEPGKKDGKPVRVAATVQVNFRLE